MNTEIEIPVSELKPALPGLARIIGRSSTLPVLQCVRVTLNQDDERHVHLQAHNLEEIATLRLPHSANGLSGQVLVPFDMLTKIVKACASGQSVRLLSNGQETKIRYTVAGSPVDRLVSHIAPEEWPEVKEIKQESVALEEPFKMAVKEAMECASEDSSRYVLNGACLDTRDKKAHYIVGSDGRHLYCANTFHFNLPEPLILPTRKFLCWAGFMEDGPWKLRMLPGVKNDPKTKEKDKIPEEPAWFSFESERWLYTAKGIDGEYPNWKQVVPMDTASWTQIVLQPAGVATLLEALPLLPGADESDRGVNLLAGNGLVIQAKGRDQADWTSINVPEASVTGKAVSIRFNRTFLLKALRFGLHTVQLNNSLEPMLFTAPGKTMVAMPLRMEQAPDPTTAAQEQTSPSNTASAQPPSPAEATHTTAERNIVSATTMTGPERGNFRTGNSTNEISSEETRSSFKAALEHLERAKANLRNIVGDLSDAASLLKSAEKEQRASAKEIEAIRGKLREIQSVKI